MNNRKQKVFSLLDSLTQKEIEDYLKERDIAKLSMLNKINRLSLTKISDTRQDNHLHTLVDKAGKLMNQTIDAYYKLGMAWVIVIVLESFYNKKYKIKDLQYYMKTLMEQDEPLKEYVYEIMKDF